MAQLSENLLNRIASPVTDYQNLVQGRQAVEMNSFNLENQQKQAKNAEAAAEIEKIATTLFSAKDPQEYARRVQMLKSQGITFDPGEDAWENKDTLQSQAMSLAQHIAEGKDVRDFAFDQQKFAADRDYRAQSLDIQREKMAQKPANSGFTLSEGQTRYGPGGQIIASGPPKTVQPRALTSVDKQAIIEADDQAQTTKNGIDMLNRALDLNKKAGAGYGSTMQAFAARNDPTGYFNDEKGQATTDFNNLVMGQALASMKAIFGSNPTEGERAVLLELQALTDKSPTEREAILKRGVELAQRRLNFNTERAQEIREGTYFGGASTVQPEKRQGANDGATIFGEAGEIPEGAIVEDEQGNRFQKNNGTLEEIQ